MRRPAMPAMPAMPEPIPPATPPTMAQARPGTLAMPSARAFIPPNVRTGGRGLAVTASTQKRTLLGA